MTLSTRAMGVAALACLVLLTQTSPAGAMAAFPAYAPQPGDESLSFDVATAKGLAATQSKDWIVAIRYFTVAQRAAPNSGPALYNLGLAEAQVPGRELRAICWFEAYLALEPNADNASAVRGQIAELDKSVLEEARRLMGQAEAAEKVAPTETQELLADRFAVVSVRLGDMDGALSWLGAAINPNYSPDITDYEFRAVLKAMEAAPKADKARLYAWRADDIGRYLASHPLASDHLGATLAKVARMSVEADMAAGRPADARKVADALAAAIAQNKEAPSWYLLDLVKSEVLVGERNEAQGVLARMKAVGDAAKGRLPAAQLPGLSVPSRDDMQYIQLRRIYSDIAQAEIALSAFVEAGSDLDAQGELLRLAPPGEGSDGWDEYFAARKHLVEAELQAGDKDTAHSLIAEAFTAAAADDPKDADEGSLIKPDTYHLSPAVTHDSVLNSKINYLIDLLDIDPSPSVDHRRDVLIIERKIADMAHASLARRGARWRLAESALKSGDVASAQADLMLAERDEAACGGPGDVGSFGLVAGCPFAAGIPEAISALPNGAAMVRAYFERLPSNAVGKQGLSQEPDYVHRVEADVLAKVSARNAKAAFLGGAPLTDSALAAAWGGLATSVLNAPIDLDLQSAIDAMTNFTPQGPAGSKSYEAVANILSEIEGLLDQRDDIISIQMRLAKPAAAA